MFDEIDITQPLMRRTMDKLDEQVARWILGVLRGKTKEVEEENRSDSVSGNQHSSTMVKEVSGIKKGSGSGGKDIVEISTVDSKGSRRSNYKGHEMIMPEQLSLQMVVVIEDLMNVESTQLSK
ncbi:hypothetical protein ACH5RR_015698 [Cinchona calisaya]|uniref:Uncharacterized protein n=1 Tax=Cinchona calisaya TaxID=153742 RepID=A0ABD2ZTW8_9GENT